MVHSPLILKALFLGKGGIGGGPFIGCQFRHCHGTEVSSFVDLFLAWEMQNQEVGNISPGAARKPVEGGSLCHFFTQVWDTSQVVVIAGFLNHQQRMGCWSSNPEACWNIWRWDFSCLQRGGGSTLQGTNPYPNWGSWENHRLKSELGRDLLVSRRVNWSTWCHTVVKGSMASHFQVRWWICKGPW